LCSTSIARCLQEVLFTLCSTSTSLIRSLTCSDFFHGHLVRYYLKANLLFEPLLHSEYLVRCGLNRIQLLKKTISESCI
jgi:hypothetical protein